MKNRTKKRNLNSIIVLITCILFSKSEAQLVNLFHYPKSENCAFVDTYYLYCGLDNKVLLQVKANGLYANIDIKSDSVTVKKITDSIFLITPTYKDVYVTLYFKDVNSNKYLDSLRTFCVAQPFSFSVNQKKHPLLHSKIIIAEMRRLFIEPMRQGCLSYEKDFEIEYYELILQRNGIEIVSSKIKGTAQIPKWFIRQIKRKSKHGDGLFAKNIALRKKNGEEILIKEYGLLFIQ